MAEGYGYKVMKVCFLSILYPFDYPRIAREAAALSEAGFEVTHLLFGEPGRFVDSGILNIVLRKEAGFRGRVAMALRLYRAAKRMDADYYHCNGVEPWILAIILKITGSRAKIVFDVIEHYPSRFYEPHIPAWLRILGRPVLLAAYRYLTLLTDRIVLAKRSLLSDFERFKRKTVCVFHYSSIETLKRYKRVDTRAGKLKESGHVVAIHIGGFSRARGSHKLLEAMRQLLNQRLIVLCIGTVYKGKDALVNQARELQVDNRIQLVDPLPYDQVFAEVVDADVGLMLYQPGILNHKYAFPLKMYDYMLAGIPVVAPRFSVEVEPVVEENACGLLVDTGNVREIAAALDWIGDNPQLSQEMGKRGQAAATREYNWESQVSTLLSVYNR